jgi:ribose transport system substrate-binding protein
MARHRLVVVTATAVAVLAAATGTVQARQADTTFGVGLKLGSVIGTIPVGSATGPWLVWNAQKCAYETAAKHPAAYKANIRKVVGGPTQIGYMNYGDTDPFGVANSRDIKKQAMAAGFKVNVYNLKYPSQTEPLTQAHNAVTKGDKGVIQAQQLDALSTSYLKILQTQGCIPSVQMYLAVKNVPAFGAVWTDVGTTQGTWLAKGAKAKGWKPSDTALVECTDPDVGASVNVMFDTAPKALAAGGFALPGGNVYKLVCKYSSTQSAKISVTNWLTAHPTVKHMLINTIDDERMQGVIGALKQAGRQGDALTIASGADPLGHSQIYSGTQGASIAFFPERYGRWLVPLLQDVMAGNPVPSFTGSGLVVVTKANIAKFYPKR